MMEKIQGLSYCFRINAWLVMMKSIMLEIIMGIALLLMDHQK